MADKNRMNYPVLRGRLKCVPALSQKQRGPQISLAEGRWLKVILKILFSALYFSVLLYSVNMLFMNRNLNLETEMQNI